MQDRKPIELEAGWTFMQVGPRLLFLSVLKDRHRCNIALTGHILPRRMGS